MDSESTTTPSSSDDKGKSYVIDPSEDLLLSFEGQSSLARKRRQKNRKSSSGKSSNRRISDTKPQISEEFLNDIPIWALISLTNRSWYAVFEFLHMEFFSEYDVVFGILVYMWAALYVTTERQYYE